MNGRGIISFLAVAVVASALGVVYSKHESRKLFVQSQRQQQVRDQLTVQWGRLQLEQSTWATDGRVEKIAREQLNMRMPPSGAVVIVEP